MSTAPAQMPLASPSSVYDLMRSHFVSFEELSEKHHSQLLAVHKLIGVVPNCDKLLEIWPPAFTTCELLTALSSGISKWQALPFMPLCRRQKECWRGQRQNPGVDSVKIQNPASCLFACASSAAPKIH
jgi:hypothetical protein